VISTANTPSVFISRRALYAVLALLLIVAVFNMGQTLRSGMTQDEQFYALLGKEVAAGNPLYLRVIDHQPPGIAFAQVPFIHFFGSTSFTFKFALVFYDVLFMLSIATVALTLTRSRLAALVALSASGYFAGLQNAVDMSWYAAVFVAVGFACALHGQTRTRLASMWLLGGGLLLALSFMTKPSVVLEFPALVLLMWIVGRNVRQIFLVLVALLVGVAMIFLYFAATGDLYEMLYIAFGSNFLYVGSNPFNIQLSGTPPNRLSSVGPYLLGVTIPYFSALLVGGLVVHGFALAKRRNTLLIALTLWFLLAFVDSALAIALEVRYFAHIIAPLVILLAVSIESAWPSRWIRATLVGALVLCLLPLVNPPFSRRSGSIRVL